VRPPFRSPSSTVPAEGLSRCWDLSSSEKDLGETVQSVGPGSRLPGVRDP